MRKLAGLVSLIYVITTIFVSVPAAKAHVLPTIRVNAGGGAYVDTQGQEWEANNYFNAGQAGSATTDPIAGTDDDTLYQSEHWTWEVAQGPLEYTFDVPNGSYDVRLHFAEIYGATSQPGGRVFDVDVQNDTVLDGLDIFSKVGAKAALIESFEAEVRDGQLVVRFHNASANNPKVSAIEVIGQEHSHTLPTIRVNAGGGAYMDTLGRQWEADNYYVNGFTNSTAQSIAGTDNDALYQTERWNWTALGTTMSYVFDVPDGTYHVKLHFAEIYEVTAKQGGRVFDIAAQGNTVFKDFDIYSEAGGFTALTKSTVAHVADGELKIDFLNGPANNPKVSAIEVIGQNQHMAHAVAGPDQTVVDVNETGEHEVTLDGSTSHTHAIGHELVSYRWSVDGTTIAASASATVSLPLGTHSVTLSIVDSAEHADADTVNIDVLSPNEADLVPQVASISPATGPESGGNTLTINGSGFYHPAADTTVAIGQTQLSGSDLTITGSNRITLTVPGGTGQADVIVTTPGGASQAQTYAYDDSAPPPVQFTQDTLISDIPRPTAMVFGPDGKLYVSTISGTIWVLTLDEDYNVTDTYTTDIIQTSEPDNRIILGLAFNPFDDPNDPKLYVSHSRLLHNGQAPYNGKVSTLSDAGLSVKQDLVTGLPVSNHDHGVNGVEFGPDGEMYISVGGNTNAGVPHSAIGGLQETPLSAATLVAPIQNPSFDGAITWDGQGNQTGGDVSVFAAGLRNPYDLIWHTNGYLYGTDNGPNNGFGPESTGCDTQGPDPTTLDKLLLLEEGNYYGHPNRVRGATDPRQCIFYPPEAPSGNGYTAPLTTFTSSTNGLAEYHVNTFGGQMRGDILTGRFAGVLFRVKLSADGRSVVTNETFQDIGGLDVAIGPDGTILVMRYWWDQIIMYRPDEPAPEGLRVLSVDNRRGPLTGGGNITITGNNFDASSTVQIGNNNCPVQSATPTKIVCTVPHGAAPGGSAATVTTNNTSATLEDAYIYLNY